MSFTVLDYYSGFFKNNFIKKDINQIAILKQIQSTCDDFNKKSIFFSKSKKLGVYVHGSVGTGKTFLLNLFSQFSKQGKKIHFNHLMNDIHNAINTKGDKEKKLESFVKELSKNIKILFIDELHIFNIVDALIIKIFFHLLEENNIFIMISSNFHPDELYQDGLQRADFLPFINHVIKKFNVISSKSDQDYRRLTLNQSKTYFTPITHNTTEEFNKLFERLVDIKSLTTKIIQTKSRKINFTKCSANVALCNFDFICNSNFGHEDYTNIANEFNLIFIEHVPIMNDDLSNQCRRFISLIDMLYDKKSSVVILAESPISLLCEINSLKKEFERTASRLYEMTIIQPT